MQITTRTNTGRSGLTIVALSFFLGGFAGCIGEAGTKEGADPGVQGYVHSTLAAGDLAVGRGAVDGIVLNENGAPLAGAYVALLTTAFHATTNKTGTFKFGEVTPGVYTLRADLAPYESLEAPVTVVVEKVTKVEVVLMTAEGTGVGFRDHVHNLWDDDEQERVLFDKDLTHQGSATCAAAVVTDIGNKGSECWLIDFHLEPETTVPPGTKEVQMSVTWPRQDAVKSVEWRYAAANQTGYRIVKDLTSGTILTVPVASPMNDHGHAAFTMWNFQMVAKPKAAGVVPINEDHFNDEFIGPYRVKIVAVKGDVFSEPPHKRYWANGPRILLADQEQRTVVGTSLARDPKAQCRYTGATSTGLICFSFKDNKTVPPGATRLLVTMDYTWAQPAASALFHHKTLAFRPGNVNPIVATWNDLLFPTPTESPAGHLVWEIKLDPKHTDAFYQSRSSWLLIIGNQGDERAGSYTPDCPGSCGGDLFKLTVEVVNDDWTEALAVGQS